MPRLKIPTGLRRVMGLIPYEVRHAISEMGASVGVRLEDRPLPARSPVDGLAPGPIIISGFFDDHRGVARSARLTEHALRDAGFLVQTHDVTDALQGRPVSPPRPAPTSGVWILHCNAPEAALLLRQQRGLAESPMYRIGYWAWELAEPPADWIRIADAFDEIWTPSRHTAAAFDVLGDKVRVMPHPVPLVGESSHRGHADTVRFTTFADARSSFARKNPLGALAAYIKAVPAPNGASQLTVKLSGVTASTEGLDRVMALSAGRPDIEVLTETLSTAALERLLMETDVLLSLHRAEGFGLTVAEAMARGGAVIATGWSGVVDFLPDAAIQRLPYALEPVSDPTGLYPAGGYWAEPDMDAAADSIRALIQEPELIRGLGLANRQAIQRLNQAWAPERLNALLFALFARRG